LQIDELLTPLFEGTCLFFKLVLVRHISTSFKFVALEDETSLYIFFYHLFELKLSY